MAQSQNATLVRLQCFEGLDLAQAAYEWNYGRQLMAIRMSEAAQDGAGRVRESDVFSRDYLLERPLLRAISQSGPCVLLIDEIDRADEAVSHLYDPVHPAVLHLLASTIAQCQAQGKGVSVCGEMAGDVAMTRLLLGLGLRSFSMHPSQILAVKQQILRCDTTRLQTWAQTVLAAEDPAALMTD